MTDLTPGATAAGMLEPFARKWCEANGIDPDEPVPPHGEWPRWYDECGAFAAMYRDIAAKMSTPTQPEGEALDVAIAALEPFAKHRITNVKPGPGALHILVDVEDLRRVVEALSKLRQVKTNG